MVAYKKGYSTNHVLLRLFENWRKALGNNLFTGMDHSKEFDCIPHDFIIAKLRTYGLTFDTVMFIPTSYFTLKYLRL